MPNQQPSPSDHPEFVEVTTWLSFEQTNTDEYEDVFCPLDIQSHPIRFVKFPETVLSYNSFIIPENEESSTLGEKGAYCRAEVCFFCTPSLITTLSVCSVFLFATTGTDHTLDRMEPPSSYSTRHPSTPTLQHTSHVDVE